MEAKDVKMNRINGQLVDGDDLTMELAPKGYRLEALSCSKHTRLPTSIDKRTAILGV